MAKQVKLLYWMAVIAATAPTGLPQALLLARSIELSSGFLPAPTRAPPNIFHGSL
ncbi:MAG: hypothetical protein KAX87_04610 [Nitrospira sp.]|nr:hypothetical protein [Nitrospira sp.]